MNSDYGSPMSELRVDGGMTANNLLMQTLADVLDIPVMRPIVAETVSLGAAYTAGLAVGFWPDTESLQANWHKAAEWLPGMDRHLRERGYRKWKKAVVRAVDWLDEDDEIIPADAEPERPAQPFESARAAALSRRRPG